MDRYKEHMERLGMPHSTSLYSAFKQVEAAAREDEKDQCARLCDPLSWKCARAPFVKKFPAYHMSTRGGAWVNNSIPARKKYCIVLGAARPDGTGSLLYTSESHGVHFPGR